MKKPHIRKVKGSRYWACNGICSTTPYLAYMVWKDFMAMTGQI